MFCCREQINREGEGDASKESEVVKASNEVEEGGTGGKEGAGAQNETGLDEEGAARLSSLPTSTKENGEDDTEKEGETGGPGFQNMVEREEEKANSEGKEKAEIEVKDTAEKVAEKETAAATPTTTASTSRLSTKAATRKRITGKDMHMAMRQTGTIAKQPSTTVRPQSIREEEEHLRRAIILSQKDQSPEELARLWREHCQPAIEHLASRGIRASMSRRPAGRDGNCLFSSLTLLQNPNINEEDQQELKKALRKMSVTWALEHVDTLNEEMFGRLQDVITNKYGRPRNKEDLKRRLRKYLQDGVYEHEGGDLMPYIMAAFLQRPLVIVDHTRRRTPTLTTIFPDLIFAPEGQIGSPLFLSRRGDHFEGLQVDNGEEPNVMAFYNAERERQFTPAPSLEEAASSQETLPTSTIPSDPLATTATASATTTTPASMTAGPSTTNAEQDPQQDPSVEQTATTSQTTTTGNNLETLSTLLQTSPHCLLQDSEDEDNEAPILPTTSLKEQKQSVADHPEEKEDPQIPDCYAIGCHSQGNNRCVVCSRWKFVNINVNFLYRGVCWSHIWKLMVLNKGVLACCDCFGRHDGGYSPKKELQGYTDRWLGNGKGHDFR